MKTKIKLKTKIILARTAGLFFVLFLMLASSGTILADNSLRYNNPQITAAKMLSLTNQSRKENGLPALIVNQKLTNAAEAKTDDMFKYQYFDHNSPNGVTPWDWIKVAGYDYRYAGENLAIDFVTTDGAHKALMASDSHRENILNSNYTEVGISVKENIFEGSKSIIIVMEFGTPLKVKMAHTSSGNINEDIKVPDDVKSDSNENNISSGINNIEEKPQKKIINSQSFAIPSDIKKDNNQDVDKNIEGRENKKSVQLNNKDNSENSGKSKKTAYGAGIIKFVGMSTSVIKKINLEKVYVENIYWESYSKRNESNSVTVMSSSGQNKSVFNSNIFYVCVLLVLFIFESSYLFLNFMISKKFRVENV